MEQRSKTHHYVPQFTLRGFARNEQVVTVDLAASRTYTQSVEKAAAENDYNTIEVDGKKSDIAERAIAREIEGPASGVLARISAGSSINGQAEYLAIARFLALQYMRVPVQREQRDALAEHLLKMEVAAGGPAGMREVLEGAEGRPVTDDEVAEAWSAVSDFDAWTLQLGRNQHIAETLAMADELVPILIERYAWAVMRWKRKHLLTSDCCVLLIRDPAAAKWRGVGLATAGMIYFPVDRANALVLVPRDGGSSKAHGVDLPGTAASARRFNAGIVMSARRRVYHHPDDSLDDLLGSNFALPKPKPVVLDSAHLNRPGFDDRSGYWVTASSAGAV